MGNTKNKNIDRFFHQICQDEELTKKFFDLHVEIVDKIAAFCKENNITVDEFHINGDGLMCSIKEGKWSACTDSSFTLEMDLEREYGKSLFDMTDKEYKKAKMKHKPFLYSI